MFAAHQQPVMEYQSNAPGVSDYRSQAQPSQQTFNTEDHHHHQNTIATSSELGQQQPTHNPVQQPSSSPAHHDHNTSFHAHTESPNRTDPAAHPTSTYSTASNGYNTHNTHNVNMTSPPPIPTTEMGAEPPQQRRPSRSPTYPNQQQTHQQPSSHQVPQPPLEYQQPGPQSAGGGLGGGEQPQFDIFEWYPKYQSCQRYFAQHAQYSAQVQAVAAFVNISLPANRLPPHSSSSNNNPSSGTNGHGPSASPHSNNIFTLPGTSSSGLPHQSRSTSPSSLPHTSISLIPYLRRLIITGLDFPGVLHGFFGDDWATGIGPLHEQERRNYLFAAKSGGWGQVKKQYDLGAGYSASGAAGETVPFMRPLQGVQGGEVEAAERSWSEWLAMEDWMLGNRCPEGLRGVGAGPRASAAGGSGNGAGAHAAGRGEDGREGMMGLGGSIHGH